MNRCSILHIAFLNKSVHMDWISSFLNDQSLEIETVNYIFIVWCLFESNSVLISSKCRFSFFIPAVALLIARLSVTMIGIIFEHIECVS